jgi:hypothetical protein
VPHDGLLDRHRRRHGVGRPHEGGHDSVAEVLDGVSLAGLDRSAQQRVVLVAQFLGGGFPEPGPQRGGAHKIGEEHDGGRPPCSAVRHLTIVGTASARRHGG